MRLWQNDPTEVEVEWFRAEPDARQLSNPTIFASSVWDERKAPARPTVGEVRRLGYGRNHGANPLGYLGENSCGRAQVWVVGGVHGVDPPITTDQQGDASCCHPVQELGEGGAGAGGRSLQIGRVMVLRGGAAGGGSSTMYAPFGLITAGGGIGGGLGLIDSPYNVTTAGGGLGGGSGAASGTASLTTAGGGLGGGLALASGTASLTTAGGGLGGGSEDHSPAWSVVTAGGGLGGGSGAASGTASLTTAGGGLGGGSGAASGTASLTTAGGGLGGGSFAGGAAWSVVTAGGGLGGGEYSEGDDDVLPGMILPYGSSSAPAGYLLCDGASYLRASYSALFAIIGTTFGAADGTHFNVPDMRRRVAMGAGGTGIFGNTVGTSGGAEQHTLTTAEIPSHAHNFEPGGNQVYVLGNPIIIGFGFAGGTQTAYFNSAVQPSGGGGAHDIVQPSMVLAYIIKT